MQLPLLQHLFYLAEGKRDGDRVHLTLGLLERVGLFALKRVELHRFDR